jgi:hypothetical protein
MRRFQFYNDNEILQELPFNFNELVDFLDGGGIWQAKYLIVHCFRNLEKGCYLPYKALWVVLECFGEVFSKFFDAMPKVV